MATRLLILLVLVVAAAAVTVAYRRHRRADEALGAHHPDSGAARWPDLPADLASPDRPTWVILTTPYCVSCDAVRADLVTRDPASVVHTVDATEAPEVADRYAVRRAPTTLRAEPGGRVVERLVGPEAVRAYLSAAST